jgi:type III restriction enzyme
MDHPAVVHDINVLTVVASESYKTFVGALQQEIAEGLTSRPRQANEAYFKDKVLATDAGPVNVTQELAAGIEFYLVQQGYVDRQKNITEKYHKAKTDGALAELPDDLKPYAAQVFALVDTVFSDAAMPKPVDGRKPKTNALNPNFDKKEFKELWERINQKAVYRVDFESDELIKKCVVALESELNVTPLQYTVQVGHQADALTADQLKSGDGFKLGETRTEQGKSVHSRVSYDLLGKIAESVQLTRKTVAEILSGMQSVIFAQYKQNPEQFISECSRIIKEQKATVIIERLSYDAVAERYDTNIFTAAQTGNDFTRATEKLKKHIFDYAMVDSDVERNFVGELDTSAEVVVYAKLPRGFLIPTPVGDYNPDWAISFVEGTIKHIYFVAETKGTLSSMQLRPDEKTKIDCARKFFAEIAASVPNNKIRYDVVDSYYSLMALVRSA